MMTQNIYVFQLFFEKNIEILISIIILQKETFSNMNYDVMIHKYQQIFQIYFGKQNTNKYNKYIIKLILHYVEIKQKVKQ